jgi:hypothetical protein
MVRCFIAAAVIAVAVAGSAHAQAIATPAAQQAQMMKLQAALVQAQAAASRPGDEALGCDVLQQQLVAAVHDPAVQGYVERAGLAAQQKKDAIDKKAAEHNAGAPGKGRLAAQTALGLVSGLVPGAGMPGLMAQAAQAPSQQAAASKNLADAMRLADEMITIMPQVMRGQRLIELAYARKCEWMPTPPQ